MSETKLSTSHQENVDLASALLTEAFQTDPVITYMLCSLPTQTRLDYLPRYFKALLTAAAMNDADFVEAHGWNSCGILMHPRKRVDNPWTLIPAGFMGLLWNAGIGGCRRMLLEWQPLADACKAKALAGQKDYYYVFFVATARQSRGKGLCSSIIKRWQEQASLARLPIWLEATTAHSMKIYAALGFEIVDEIILGGGKAGPDGLKFDEGEGEGVKVWGMIWWPSGAKDLALARQTSEEQKSWLLTTGKLFIALHLVAITIYAGSFLR